MSIPVYDCPPQEGQPWRLEGTTCYFAGAEFQANFSQTMSRNCGDWYDFADPARCKPKNVNHPARRTDPPPPPPSAATCPVLKGDSTYNPWSKTCVSNSDCADRSKYIGVQTSEPGNALCEPQPAPQPPICDAGHHLDNNVCVLNTCPTNQVMDDYGNCHDKPAECVAPYYLDQETNTCKLRCDTGFHIDSGTNTCVADEKPPLVCEPGTALNSAGTACVPIAIPGTSSVCPAGTYQANGICVTIPGGAYNDNTSSGWDRLSSNYQVASIFSDVFKTPENDSKTGKSTGSFSSMLLLGGAAVAGIGGFYYFTSVNGRRRYYR